MLNVITPGLSASTRRGMERASMSASFRSALATPTPGINDPAQGMRGVASTPHPQLKQSIGSIAMRPSSPPIRNSLRDQRSGLSSTTPRDLHIRPPAHANYADHRPLSASQNALLALGSGVVGVMDTSRGGERLGRKCLRSPLSGQIWWLPCLRQLRHHSFHGCTMSCKGIRRAVRFLRTGPRCPQGRSTCRG